jgi:hypothetical protein
VGLTNLGSESETCVGSRVRLVGVFISFEKNFYRLPFTPPSLVRRIGPSAGGEVEHVQANKLRGSSIGLTREGLVEQDQPGKSTTSGGGGAAAARPRKLTRQ